MKEKVEFMPDKRTWHPSPLLGQITLVTSLNSDGTSNVAPKRWISMMAFSPPLLALGCNLGHWTGRNILERKEFVVNIPGAELAEQAWKVHELPHPRPVEAAGLTPIPAIKVKPPRIEECRAHLECVLDQHLAYGQELVILGRIVAGSIDAEALQAEDPYSYLRLVVFLEGHRYGIVEQAHQLPSQPERRTGA
ncbi:MAG: flavin reductase family protein [Anaerolineae bacterium]|nr:flavin reductase family protein [Anaerolineae bacterium]